LPPVLTPVDTGVSSLSVPGVLPPIMFESSEQIGVMAEIIPVNLIRVMPAQGRRSDTPLL